MEIRDLTTDDLDQVLDARRRSFGPLGAADAERWRALVAPTLPEGRYLGAFLGGRLAASARLRRLTQWWHGRPQALAGVAGVIVNPEFRGRGVGTAIMGALLERAVEQGSAMSSLYPATTPIYRSLGYEHTGTLNRVTLPAEALRAIRPSSEVTLRRMTPADAPEVIELLGRLHGAARSSGPTSWEERTWRRWLGEEDDFLYMADDGFAVYRWDKGDLEVDGVHAGSAETARTLWSLIGSGSSVAKNVTANVAPDDPVFWLTRERTREQITAIRWMGRVLDVQGAIERRGYPSGLSLSAVVTVDDTLMAGNSGTWRIDVSGGSGTATSTGPTIEGSGARLGIGALTALYSGVPAATLRRAGLMAGDDEHDEALDTIFAATPYSLDYF
ncbi:GNAT family N-acetyltransferase [Nonomuraea soli]|uniref:Putative acetyltransferase n=1 Tax=Nonomuraea soli TaxID=1032476 RepID=A0A7W0HTW5_9ACTN|nr:GNAT family N-acetyltransferase [Nonomuraea soli]MBA2895136.1 putative acetyltransferase [Nonomuraea soli]